MGRDSGWLAAASVLGKRNDIDPPHIILMPEQTFSSERFLEEVEAVYKRLGYVTVVAAETIRDEHGQPLGATGQVGTDAFQHPLLSGTAQYLIELVKQHFAEAQAILTGRLHLIPFKTSQKGYFMRHSVLNVSQRVLYGTNTTPF